MWHVSGSAAIRHRRTLDAMPDVDVCIDSHQHFWRYSASDYPWIDERMVRLRRDFLPADLAAARQTAGIAAGASVAVQARTSLRETEWLLELAADDPSILAVVGWVELCDPDLAALLDRLARQPRLKGLRHVLQDEPDDRYMLRPDFVRGLAMLARYDLAYDLLLHPRHLPIAAELVARLPQQRFILDHLAKPAIATAAWEPWASDFARLAQFPNVYCKLSGMVTEADWDGWTEPQLHRYARHALACFGPERVMFGSDWPVCTLASDYLRWLQTVEQWLAPLSPSQRADVWAGTARRAYRL